MTAPDTHHKIPLTIRLDKDLIDKIVSAAGQKTKNEFIIESIKAHLSAPQAHQDSTNNAPLELLKADNVRLEDLNKAKNETIRILEEDKGFILSEFQKERAINERLLMPSQSEIKVKKWFQFWKK